MNKFGASLSILYAAELGINPLELLIASHKQIGLKRFRFMSYWSLHELTQNKFDFTQLDELINYCHLHKLEVSLCIGLRQPRWPENHQPDWAQYLQKTDEQEWEKALLRYIKTVVKRYKNYSQVVSWQLENEALNRSFGLNGNFSRKRLRQELKLVRTLSKKPVIMTTSNSWGIPVRAPRPNIYGFSLYRSQYKYKKGKSSKSWLPSFFYKLRMFTIKAITCKNSFIHELQCEPWGNVGTAQLPLAEQLAIMSLEHMQNIIAFAQRTNLYPIDLWGLEWWYYLKTQQNTPQYWQYVGTVCQKNN